jgi:hypothetical protein
MEWLMLVGEHGGDAMVPRIAMMKALRRHKPKAEAEAAHVAVKTEMLQMRLMEKRRELVRRDDVDALIDQIAGTVLTHLSGMSARCSRDMMVGVPSTRS